MSCSLCRLPFVTHPTFVSPKSPPRGIVSERQERYMQYGVVMGNLVPGGCFPVIWAGDNHFINAPAIPVMTTVVWETGKLADTEPGTVIALHTACADILRHALGASDYSVESMVKLSMIDAVLGRPHPGPDAGRLRQVKYEDVGEKVDVRPYWVEGKSKGNATFEYSAFKASGLDWTLNRPDTFPMFYEKVKPARAAAREPSPASVASITKLFASEPVAVLRHLLSHLSDRSFYALLSTCRLLRKHGLTTFQPEARARVLALEWAVPLETEYAAACRMAGNAKDGGPGSVRMAHAVNAPVDGDWMLYLSQVHRTPNMRARRWLWALAREVRRAFDEAVPKSALADVVDAKGTRVPSEEMKKLKERVETLMIMTLIANGKM
ncbi:hypothetical protein WOLCODRAFT_137915 [Wolfiporia cocos MD-104 SS10]|uniref:Uncharacterized protein n=1 Tax=Wolfiporia cocos (strain MD-104) TaxID=742152 RepID=A0A2H3JJT9_WOLCO|nr:hypothetical protein WOLCODRAFT_137915 [Wolfiporia cocos MD-104 SS10]